ncbi:T9SS type A sorting domain-containing protein [Candidatus Woesearchaeota archaeon]|nr:T9SS type A sorting domain-containing protein [Candidatus Woesearchaeota archaeon]
MKKYLLLIPAALLAANIAKGESQLEAKVNNPNQVAINDSLIQNTFDFLTDSLGLQGYIADTMYVNVNGTDVLVQAYFDKWENQTEMEKQLGVIVADPNSIDSLAVVGMDGVYYPINRGLTGEQNAVRVDSLFKNLEPEVGTEKEHEIPSGYELGKAYPNPGNPSITIPYSVPKRGKVSIGIYDVLGREVIRPIDRQSKTAGNYNLLWDGKDKHGNQMASGVYPIRYWNDRGMLKKSKVTIIK